MNKDRILTFILAMLGVIPWLFPDLNDKLKWLIFIVAAISIAFLFAKDRISYFTRKYWQEILSVSLLGIGYLILKYQFPALLLPAAIIVLISTAIAILISTKYKGNIVYTKKRLVKVVPIDTSWQLNHWGYSFAHLEGSSMIFDGANPLKEDGSNIDLFDELAIGGVYEISCLVKSQPNTTGAIRLWCHDKSREPNGISEATKFITPSTSGQRLRLVFRATFNKSIRIHLQYQPGDGAIEVSDVKIIELIQK